MKTKIFLLAATLLLCDAINAQSCSSGVQVTSDPSSTATTNFIVFANSLNSGINSNTANIASILPTQGSQYLASTFEKSNIYVGDELLGAYYSRYNAYNQEIEIKKTNLEEEQFKALIHDEKIRVAFVDKEIQYTSFINKDGLKQNDYLISKTNGTKYRLYQRISVKYKEGQKSQNSFVAAIPPKYSQFSEYYLKDLNSNLVSYVPAKKSKLLKLFKNNEQIQIASIIKKRGFNLKKELDLVQLFDFANTLKSDLVSAGN